MFDIKIEIHIIEIPIPLRNNHSYILFTFLFIPAAANISIVSIVANSNPGCCFSLLK